MYWGNISLVNFAEIVFFERKAAAEQYKIFDYKYACSTISGVFSFHTALATVSILKENTCRTLEEEQMSASSISPSLY